MFFLTQTTQVLAEHANVAVEAVQQAAEHAEHAENAQHGAAHAVNWVTLLAQALGDTSIARALVQGEKVIFAILVIALITFLCMKISAHIRFIPDKVQLVLETIVQLLDDFVCSIIGPHGREHTPFIGAIFVYIFASNLFGLIPLQNSATAYVTTTGALAGAVFFYVQGMGIAKNGLRGYIIHLAGSPVGFVGYMLIPLNFPIHVIGEFTKPLSLMFRLYGNVMAGHILVAVFLGMGVNALKPLGIPFGLPMHFPFLFLELLVALIQAFVFSLLSTLYIGSMLPHEHEHDEHQLELETEHEVAQGEIARIN